METGRARARWCRARARGPSFSHSTVAFPPRPFIPHGRRDRCSRATSEPSRHSAGRARPIRSARRASAKRGQRILSGEQSIESLVNDTNGEIKAHILERDGKVVIEKTCPTHGTFTDTLAIDPAFLQAASRALFPGRDFRGGHRHAAQSRHVVDQARPRRGAHDRPDQPLQHDVRSVLHGRQSGRLRPRADARRGRSSCSTTRSPSSRGGR